jgi:hypothetical protein
MRLVLILCTRKESRNRTFLFILQNVAMALQVRHRNTWQINSFWIRFITVGLPEVEIGLRVVKQMLEWNKGQANMHVQRVVTFFSFFTRILVAMGGKSVDYGGNCRCRVSSYIITHKLMHESWFWKELFRHLHWWWHPRVDTRFRGWCTLVSGCQIFNDLWRS